MITYYTGDLFTTDKKVIGHGVNCEGVMGSGFAVEIRNRFPETYHAYRNICLQNKLKPGMVYPYREKGMIILNIASQQKKGANASLDWLAIGLWKTLGYCEDRNLGGLAIPRIGAGIGGLKWKDVDPLINEIFNESPLELEIWTDPKTAEKEAKETN